MFDIIDLPKTPRIARRLVEMSKIGGLEVESEIVELAEKDLISVKNFDNLPFSLTKKEVDTIQFISDRRGRCVVLEDSTIKANNSVLSHVWMTNKFPVLIITNVTKYIDWFYLIHSIWPEATINIFGRGVLRRTDILQNIISMNNPNVFITNEPNKGCDFYITKPSEVYKNNLMKMNKFSQVIVNYVTDIGFVTKNTSNELGHICTEVPASLIIVNICQCVSSARVSNFICFDDINWEDENNLAIKTILQFLHPNIRFLPFIVHEYEHLGSHIKENNINISSGNWLPIMNICPHLVK